MVLESYKGSTRCQHCANTAPLQQNNTLVSNNCASGSKRHCFKLSTTLELRSDAIYRPDQPGVACESLGHSVWRRESSSGQEASDPTTAAGCQWKHTVKQSSAVVSLGSNIGTDNRLYKADIEFNSADKFHTQSSLCKAAKHVAADSCITLNLNYKNYQGPSISN